MRRALAGVWRWSRVEALTLVLVVVWPVDARGQAASVATVRPLAFTDFVRSRRFAEDEPIAVSPDERWVAYTLLDPARPAHDDSISGWYARRGEPWLLRGAEMWLANTTTGEARNLSGEKGVSWGGVWSPDGRWLAFYSTRDGAQRLWVLDVRSGNTRRVSNAITFPDFQFEVPAWTPDSRHLVAKLRPATVATEFLTQSVAAGEADATARVAALGEGHTSVEGVRLFQTARTTGDTADVDSSHVANMRADLGVIDVQTGATRRLVHGEPIRGYRIAPDGRSVAIMVVRPHAASGSPYDTYDLRLIMLGTGASRVLARAVAQEIGMEMSWSPDGSLLAFTNWIDADPDRGACEIVAPDGGMPRRLFGRQWSCGGGFRGPVWAPKGHLLYVIGHDTLWAASGPGDSLRRVGDVPGATLSMIVGVIPDSTSPRSASDPGTVVVDIRDTGSVRPGVARMRLGRNAEWETHDGQLGSSNWLETGVAGSTIAYQWQTAQMPPDLWVTTDGFHTRRRLTHIAPALDGYVFGSSRTVSWRDDDGTVLHGTVVLPAGYATGRRYPMFVAVYGGASPSTALNEFGLWSASPINAQLLATRGYAVFAPDAPVHPGTTVRDLAKDVLPGVNAVIDLGIADGNRLALGGASYGGYSTLALLVQTTRFRAAIEFAGISSLFTQYGWIRPQDDAVFGALWVEGGQGGMNATPWERRDRYVENSPYFYLDRIATPVLIVHGSRDQAAPISAAEELFVALRRLNKPAVLAEYVGEMHFSRYWSVLHQLDFNGRCVEWLDSHLGAAQP